MNFENYFSALQYLYIGYYAHSMITVSQLAKHLSLPTDVLKNITEDIKLKQRILKGNEFEIMQALKDFAIRVIASK